MNWRNEMPLVCDRCGVPEGRCVHALDKDNYAIEPVSEYRRNYRRSQYFLIATTLFWIVVFTCIIRSLS